MKRVHFKENLTETVYAPMFEEHLIMELYWFRDYFMGFLNLTVQDILLECCDHDMFSIYEIDNLPISHPGKRDYVTQLIHYLKSNQLFCESYLSLCMKDLFQTFTEKEFDNFKQFQTIVNEDLPELFTLYYCIHIYFWCLHTCTLLHYNKVDKYVYVLYCQQCLQFYQEILQIVVPNVAIAYMFIWIDFIDSFFVTNFGSKCSLLGR